MTSPTPAPRNETELWRCGPVMAEDNQHHRELHTTIAELRAALQKLYDFEEKTFPSDGMNLTSEYGALMNEARALLSRSAPSEAKAEERTARANEQSGSQTFGAQPPSGKRAVVPVGDSSAAKPTGAD